MASEFAIEESQDDLIAQAGFCGKMTAWSGRDANMEKPIQVLLVEDNLPDARLLREMLSEQKGVNYAVVVEPQLSRALRRLAEERFDIVLTDLSLPDSEGLATFRQLHAAAPTVPMLVLSGRDDETLAITAVREGAQDYLVKGQLDAQVLGRSLRHAIERERAEQALQESERHYRTLLESITDYTYSVPLADGFAAGILQPSQLST